MKKFFKIILLLLVIGVILKVAGFDLDTPNNDDASRTMPEIESPEPTPPEEVASEEHNNDESSESSVDEKSETPEPVISENSTFEIYFLDVGQGDAAVVLCDNHSMLIDGGNNKQSSLIYSFLKSHGISHLDYIVASHPDADHVGGLAGALNYATVDNAFCTETSHDTKAFNSFVKYLDAQNVSITVPSEGSEYSLGSAKFTIIGPPKGHPYSDNTSLVIRIEYGGTSFLFTGDCETEEEKAILDAGYDVKSTVLKVGHHGSNSSSCYQFIYYVEPEYAVISVGGDNSYGHPTDNVLSRLHDADVRTFRTDMQGDIHCTSDGKMISFDVEKITDIDTFSAAGGYDNWKATQNKSTDTGSNDRQSIGASATYIINTNTGKFHYPTCSSVNQMKESNKKEYSGTRDELIAQGYSPCGRCHP